MTIRRLLSPLLLLALLAVPAAAGAADGPVAVSALRETPAVFDDEADRDADSDDPAIWVNPLLRGRSFFVGTKKNAGLSAFDLQGRVLQDIPAPAGGGRFNNVDGLTGVRVGGLLPRDVMLVTDRGLDRLRTYVVDPIAATFGRPPLREVTAPDAPFVFSATPDEVATQTTAYGLAAFSERGVAYAVVSRRSRTSLALLRLKATRSGVSYDLVDTITFPKTFTLSDGTAWTPCEDPGDDPQFEGMVVDARRGLLYAGQEDVGIWRVAVSGRGFGRTPVLQEKVREFGVPGVYDPDEDECVAGADPGFGGTHISADVEGLTVDGGVLLASSQGDDTFAVFGDRGLGAYRGSFHVVDSAATDSVQESDGAQLLLTPLGSDFPRGIFITQDGDAQPESASPRGDATNFKLVRADALPAFVR
ncbi:MAG TPA: phytase [Baekduia sp.]|nr:phytase [Baekduia sp.]